MRFLSLRLLNASLEHLEDSLGLGGRLGAKTSLRNGCSPQSAITTVSQGRPWLRRQEAWWTSQSTAGEPGGDESLGSDRKVDNALVNGQHSETENKTKTRFVCYPRKLCERQICDPGSCAVNMVRSPLPHSQGLSHRTSSRTFLPRISFWERLCIQSTFIK